jgi:hypothetical protein
MSSSQKSRVESLPARFPFERLSTELAIEIIRFTSVPDFTGSASNPYSNAVTMCLVSHPVRQAAILELLDTVLLSAGRNVHAFIRAILMQRDHRLTGSCLAVDYSMHIRRMWCGTCPEALVDEPRDSTAWLDYGALWEVMRNVERLGIHYESLHLIYNGLATEVDAMEVDEIDGKSISSTSRWKCQKITFAGDYWRWKPLTSTKEGSAFLANITHLVLWMTDNSHERNSASMINSKVTPMWMENVPFEMMRNLTDVGFVLPISREDLDSRRSIIGPRQMLVYHQPKRSGASAASVSVSLEHDPMVFRRWAVDDKDPASHGIVLPLYVAATHDWRTWNWEKAWAIGQSEYTWEALMRRIELARQATCVVEVSHW